MVAKRLVISAVIAACCPLPTSQAYGQSRVGAKPLQSDVAWHWQERPNQQHKRVWARRKVIDLRVVPNNDTVVVQQRGGWKVTLRDPSTDSAEIIIGNGLLYVAHYSSRTTGATLYALDAKTGQSVWRHRLRALGPVAHSQYRNELRLKMDRGRLVAFGRESGGRYIEIRHPASGRMLRHSLVPAALAHVPWNWHGNPKKRRWYVRPVRLGPFVFTNTKNKSEDVRRLTRSGRVRWKTKLKGSGFCGNAAMARRGSVLYVVHFCGISTGARLYALRTSNGSVLWSEQLIGIGPIGHSKYFNDAQIRVRRGMVIVYGNEAFGRYVEARDAMTGRLMSSRSFN